MRWVMLMLVSMLLAVASATASAEEADDLRSPGELESLVAPVALFPDTLLSQVLIAATYPLQIVEAARWSRENPGLEGAEAVAAVEDERWDPSVRSLAAFPDLLARMSDDLSWTARLGDAFLFQEEAVMAAVQALRQRADQTGSLADLEQTDVVREQEAIILRPRRPDIVYIPYYRPVVVYGGWPHAAFSPVHWHPPYGYRPKGGFYRGAGVRIRGGFFYSGFDWGRSHVFVIGARHSSRPIPRYIKGHVRQGSIAAWRESRTRHRPESARGREVERRQGGHRIAGPGSRVDGGQQRWITQDRGVRRGPSSGGRTGRATGRRWSTESPRTDSPRHRGGTERRPGDNVRVPRSTGEGERQRPGFRHGDGGGRPGDGRRHRGSRSDTGGARARGGRAESGAGPRGGREAGGWRGNQGAETRRHGGPRHHRGGQQRGQRGGSGRGSVGDMQRGGR